MQIIELKSDKAEKLLLIKLCAFNRYSFSEGKGEIRLKMEKENIRKYKVFQIIPILFIIISLAFMVLSVTFNVLNKNERFIRYIDT